MENNQLTKFEGTNIVETINRIPSLTEDEKRQLMYQIASDDVELRRQAKERLDKSELAVREVHAVMNQVENVNKKGMYMTGKHTVETGSGKFQYEMKGGDGKLIVPVLVIVSITIIAALVIVFWN